MTRLPSINERIRSLRKSRSLMQAEFAAMIGCTIAQVAQWEAGNNYPKLANLIRIAKVFEVTTDWILLDPPEADAAPLPAQSGDAHTWRDLYIAQLKERLGELERRTAALAHVEEQIGALEAFVLEQIGLLTGRDQPDTARQTDAQSPRLQQPRRS